MRFHCTVLYISIHKVNNKYLTHKFLGANISELDTMPSHRIMVPAVHIVCNQALGTDNDFLCEETPKMK